MDINYRGLQPRGRSTTEEEQHSEIDVDVDVGLPAAAAGMEFELELECQRQFGHEKFSFYCPEIVGQFIVTLYSLSSAQGANKSRTYDSLTSSIYAAIIYEDGEVVDFSKDPRFKSCTWVNRKIRNCDHSFNRPEIIQMMKDLYQLSEKDCQAADKTPATYRRVKVAAVAW